MMYFLKSNVLGGIALVGVFLTGCASTSGPIVANMETEPRPFLPTLTLHSLPAEFSDVTKVSIKFTSMTDEVALQSLGNGAWEVRFSPEAYQELRRQYGDGPMIGELTVRSKNVKGRTITDRRSIEVWGRRIPGA